ncbi:MAG: dihydropteroate synthase [Candidatus Firestonebacteria bacterium]
MFIIGERINGMFKKVGVAIVSKDKKTIQDLAMSQIKAGANALDVNVGPTVEDPVAAMEWLIDTISEVTDFPLAIDSPKVSVLEAGLKKAKKAIINSTTCEQSKMSAILPLAKKYNVPVVALTISEKGVPADSNGRVELAATLVACALELEIPSDNIYIDPVILPINVAQPQGYEVLKAISECKMIASPSPKTVLGLSNVSQGTKQRPIINRTYLVMAAAYGLDAAIVDPLDTELMNAMITADLLLNKNIYCDSYLDAYKKST